MEGPPADYWQMGVRFSLRGPIFGIGGTMEYEEEQITIKHYSFIT